MFKWIMIVAGLGFALVSGYVWCSHFWAEDKEVPSSGGEQLLSSKTIPATSSGGKVKAERIKEEDIPQKSLPAWVVVPATENTPNTDSELEQLDEEMRQAVAVVIAQLEKVIALGDVTKLGALLSLLRKSPSEIFGKNEVPTAVRRVMVRAASTRARALASAATASGSTALSDISEAAGILADFVTDSDPAVAAEAMQAFNSNAFNPSYSDSARAVFVVEGSQLNLDSTSLEVLLSSVNNMRHSVAYDTIEQISQTGSEAAKTSLTTVIQRYAVDSDVTTVSDLKTWLTSHPDGANDDTRFGGFKVPDTITK